MNYKDLANWRVASLVSLVLAASLVSAISLLVPQARATPATATFKEWDLTNGGTFSEFQPHVIQVDKTGVSGLPAGSVWSVVDNPGCDLANLDPATNTYTHYLLNGSGETEGIALNTANGDVWGTIAFGPPFAGGTGGVVGSPVYVRLGGSNSFNFYFTGPTSTRGIAAAPDGNVFYAEPQAGNIVHLIKTTGAATRWLVGGFPSYVAIAADGKVYFTLNSANVIGRLDPAVSSITEWTVPTAASGPLGIFIDPTGLVWFAESSGNKIGRLDPVGNTITEFSKAGVTVNPRFVAVSSAGQAFYTEGTDNEVGILTPSGTEIPVPVPPVTMPVTPTSTVFAFNTRSVTPQILTLPFTLTTVTGIDPPGIVDFPIPTAASDPVGVSDVVLVTTVLPSGATVTNATIYFDEHFDHDFTHGKIGCLVSSIIKPPAPRVPVEKTFTQLNPVPSGTFVPLNTLITWRVDYVVTNVFSTPITSVVLKDHFSAALAVDTTTITFSAPAGSGATAPAFSTTTGNQPQWRFTWSIGTLQPGQTATLSVNVFTRLNPAGVQEFTQPGLQILNSGATLKWIPPSGIMQSFTTLPVSVMAGNTVGAILGIVTSSGTAVSGVTVTLSSGTTTVGMATTSDVGFYHFDALSPGSYTVSATTTTGTATSSVSVTAGVITTQNLST